MNTTNNGIVTVRTEQGFEMMLRTKCPHFIFEGPKAREIFRKLREAEEKQDAACAVGVLAGIACLFAAPFTLGTSLLGLTVTTGVVALSEPVIIAIIAGVVAIAKEIIKSIKDYKVKELDNERLEFIRK